MKTSERGFLLLCSDLGDTIAPLSLHQLELLRRRMTAASICADDCTEISPQVLQRLGYSAQMAMRLFTLFNREDALDAYLSLGAQKGCFPLSCVSSGFPQTLRPKLGRRCPAVLFYRGNLSLLQNKRIALVGSRLLKENGSEFARHIGMLAAQEGYTLVSGNAKGADKTAQEACLLHGGSVIAVVSEPLCNQMSPDERILYLSESGWHQAFSAERALCRNRLIYALAEKSFVAQCAIGSGTWKGAKDALARGISSVFVNDDCSSGASALSALGAIPVSCTELHSISSVFPEQASLFNE